MKISDASHDSIQALPREFTFIRMLIMMKTEKNRPEKRDLCLGNKAYLDILLSQNYPIQKVSILLDYYKLTAP